ncbi:MAG: tetratricopeptide repeat protein [Phycisphaerales bacterium]
MDRNAETIFHEARAIADPTERSRFLESACRDDPAMLARVRALLDADAAAGGFLNTADRPAGDQNATILQDRPVGRVPGIERSGDLIGRYKLLELIGEGGFGSVWMAEQREPVRRRVALKVIKLGMDTKQVVARFEAERQALAMMDHPNIARVLDGGSTETGRPYFVMELVRGVPLLEYCTKHGVDTRTRLELFVRVCQAIQHAHQKGIIHRDIKPSNVLVTMHDGVPVPKVIDFGIAKATNSELTQRTLFTEHRQIIGTPAYMSPEQAELSGLDVDTRSDIYSLGVLLYELLTGTTPFAPDELLSKGFAEMMRIIREVEPARPSTRLSMLSKHASGTTGAPGDPLEIRRIGALVRGDLDWIVMKCLEKDRRRRYETANALAADIDRHLSDQPVTAGPPSARYRLGKFVKRNRTGVLAGGLIALLLVLGVIGTTAGMLRAIDEKKRADAAAQGESEQRELAEASARAAREQAERAVEAEARAQRRADELQQLADFQALQLQKINPQTMGIRLRRDLLGAVADADREAVRSALMGVNFTSVAMGVLSENLFEDTISTIDDQFADQPLVRALLLQSAAVIMRELGLLELAIGPQERSLALRREHLGDEHPETLSSIGHYGVLLQRLGRLEEAERFELEALEGRRRVLGEDHPATLLSLTHYGMLLRAQGRLSEAEPVYQEALESRRRVLGDRHPDTLVSLNNMGVLMEDYGRYEEAERYHRESVVLREALHGPDDPHTLTAKSNLAGVLSALQRLDESEALEREALAGFRTIHGDDHPETIVSLRNLGNILFANQKYDESEAISREAIERSERLLGPDHVSTILAKNNLARLLSDTDRRQEAMPYLREITESTRRTLGDEHYMSLGSMYNLSATHLELGNAEEEFAILGEAASIARRASAQQHWIAGIVLRSYAASLRDRERFAEAEPKVLDAIKVFDATMGPDSEHALRSVSLAITLYQSWHEAEPGDGHDAAAERWQAELERRRAPESGERDSG